MTSLAVSNNVMDISARGPDKGIQMFGKELDGSLSYLQHVVKDILKQVVWNYLHRIKLHIQTLANHNVMQSDLDGGISEEIGSAQRLSNDG